MVQTQRPRPTRRPPPPLSAARLDAELAVLLRGKAAENGGGGGGSEKCSNRFSECVRVSSVVVNVAIVTACAATLAFQTSHCLLR